MNLSTLPPLMIVIIKYYLTVLIWFGPFIHVLTPNLFHVSVFVSKAQTVLSRLLASKCVCTIILRIRALSDCLFTEDKIYYRGTSNITFAGILTFIWPILWAQEVFDILYPHVLILKLFLLWQMETQDYIKATVFSEVQVALFS